MTQPRVDGAARLHVEAVEPTLFFVHAADGLCQAVDLTVRNSGPDAYARAIVRLGGREVTTDLGTVAAGTSTYRVYAPDIAEPGRAELSLVADAGLQDSWAGSWVPQRHWEVHLVHGSHHDLGYTDLPSNVLREHDRFLDDVVAFCEQTVDWPEECQFRYVIEQGWSALHYFQNRPQHAIDRLVYWMRQGRIELTALFGNETSELCGHEEQVRLLYPSFRLKRRYGIPIRSAELNDVPGLSWGLVSVLSGAGIRYLAPGIPDYFSWGHTVHPFWDEEAVLPRDGCGAFWWEGPDASRILFWYGQHADLWTCEQTAQDLPKSLRQMQERGYPFATLRLKFIAGHRDNSPVDVRLSYIAREWNSRWAYPRLIVSTNTGFFERLEREAGSRLRVLRGDLPNTDYTVGATSTAKETGVNRLTHDQLLSAEKLASCASLATDYAYPADTLAEAYEHTMLYDEHTWGMAHPIGPAQDECWSQKAQYAYRAAALAHDVLLKSSNRLADSIGLPDEGYHVVVFNTLSFSRTDLVTVPARAPAPCGRPMYWQYLNEAHERPPMLVNGTALGRNLVELPLSLLLAPFELIDVETGHSIPYQVVTLGDPLAPRPYAAQRFALSGPVQIGHKELPLDPAQLVELVFVAQDVPPLGFRTYRLRPVAEGPQFGGALSIGECHLENRFYRVTLDPQSGAVTSIYDKELEREWVEGSAPHGFNQLVVRSPCTGEASMPTQSCVVRGESGPVFSSLIVRGDGLGCPQRMQEITLYEGLKRVDFSNRVLKDATPHLETYFAFPFAVANPRFRYEASNAVIAPICDQLPGSNTDAYAMQHWVSVSDSEGCATWASLEAPVMEVGGLWPGYVSQAHHAITPPGYGHEFLRDLAQLKRGRIYSLVMMSNFRTNFQPVQVADLLFRYSITTHRGDRLQALARDFGWAAATPLVPVTVKGPQQGALSPWASFCRVDRPNVLLVTLKAAEDGDGLILRLRETEGQDTVVIVSLPFLDVCQAFRTNLVEENEASLSYDRHSFRMHLPANGLVTVRCRSSRRWPATGLVASY